jgi:hypothetical protein
MAVPKFQFQAQPIRHLSRPQPPILVRTWPLPRAQMRQRKGGWQIDVDQKVIKFPQAVVVSADVH